MYGVSTRSKLLGAAGLLAIVASVAYAAGVQRITQDRLILGSGTTTDKVIEFDVGLSGSNPTITAASNGDLTSSGAGGFVPTGGLVPFAGSVAPSGWLLADGSAVSRTTYARLFAAIGTTYGAGDLSTTFNLPDMRGRVIAGDDDMGGTPANRITNAVAGFVGTTIGAAGGTQSYTPSGTNGGSQSIAHTHNIAHAHQWSFADDDTAQEWYSTRSLDDSITVIDETDDKIFVKDVGLEYTHTPGTNVRPDAFQAQPDNTEYYTTGALSAPTGSGSTAASGAMSANATVNGSSFTFTGTAGANVPPTMIMNYIVKT